MVTSPSPQDNMPADQTSDPAASQLTPPGLPLALLRTVPSLTIALITFFGPPDGGSIFDILFSDSDGVWGPGRGRH